MGKQGILTYFYLLTTILTIGTLTGNAQPEPQPTKIPVLFSHGFSGCKMRPLLYTRGYEDLVAFLSHKKPVTEPLKFHLFDTTYHKIHAFNFPDVQIDLGLNGSIPNPLNANLAQHEDIKTLARALDEVPDKALIGFGISRGAATWLTTLGTKKTDKNIRALVLESPFATTEEVSLYAFIKDVMVGLKTIVSTLNIKQASKVIFETMFNEHDVDGISPIKSVTFIPQSIPIMLIHSEEDGVIPINHTRELYMELKNTGHQEVYLVELPYGDHAELLSNKSATAYCQAVHAFYKHYNLPHDVTFAHGIDVTTFQPSIKEVKARIQHTLEEQKTYGADDAYTIWSTSLNIA